MASRILAPNGNPARREVALSHLYGTPRNTAQDRWYRPRYHNNHLSPRDSSGPVNVLEWSELLKYSRGLFAQLGNVSGAVIQKNNYAVGDAWKPQYTGADPAWGQAAEEWLRDQWYPIADTRGETFDLSTSFFLDSIAQDVDGDALMVLGKTATDFPKLAFYSAARIGNRESGGEVTEGPFKGASICNGIIKDRFGAIIGFRLLGDEPDQDRDISTANAQLLFEPVWTDQQRGIPRIGHAVLDWLDVQDIDVFLKRGVKLESSVGLMHYTEDGTAPDASDILTTRDSSDVLSDVKIERREGGEFFYLKANSGEKIEGFKGERPSPNTEAFIARLERRGLLAIGWHYELIDPSKIGGASVRLIQDQARTSVKARQKTVSRRALRAIRYAVALAMKSGRLPRNDSDWWKWTFEKPALITVDAGYDRKADVEDLKLGLTTEAAIAQKSGRWHEDVRAQREKEIRGLLNSAKQMGEEYGLSTSAVLDLLYQRSANPTPLEIQKEGAPVVAEATPEA